jgi:hypothetical protein|tara:strand:+ start:127 stop:330 length:204 start_codon:yes stop_codon:yes gene_type:complete
MDELKAKIVEMLTKNTDGMTIADMVRQTLSGRATIMIRLAELRAEGKLRERKIGQVKLIYLEKKRSS